MAQFNLPATEPSLDGIQNALGLSGVTNYAELIVPQDFGWAPPKFWAKWQPMHLNRLHKITDNERAANGYGLIDNNNFECNDSTDVNRAFTNAANRIYSLQRNYPKGGINTSPYRPWDYYNEAGTESYNNEAVPPFSFEVEEIKNQGFMQATAYAYNDSELPVANITLSDLQNVGGANSIVTKDGNTCFGLLYTKDGGSVQVLGADGRYPAFMDNGDRRVCDIQLVGDGTYRFVFIVLNKQTKRFITIPPYSVQEATVTSSGVVKAYIEVYGEYEYNASGTQLTIRNLTILPKGGNAVAGNVGLYICSFDTPEDSVESDALYTTSYSYAATNKDTERVLFTSQTITANGWDARSVIPWVVTTSSTGIVTKRQLDWIDNSGDIA